MHLRVHFLFPKVHFLVVSIIHFTKTLSCFSFLPSHIVVVSDDIAKAIIELVKLAICFLSLVLPKKTSSTDSKKIFPVNLSADVNILILLLLKSAVKIALAVK